MKISSQSLIRSLSLLTLGLGLVLVMAPAFAAPQIPHKIELRTKKTRAYKATWSTALSGGLVQDDLSNRRTQAGLQLRLGLDYALTEYLSLDLVPSIRFRNGYVQSATNTNGRESMVELQTALARFHDKNYFEIKAGVVDLEENHSKLLTESSFPAIGALISTGKRSTFSADLLALVAVPSSTSQTNNSNDLEKTPTFNSLGLNLAVRSEELTGNLRVSMFQYRDLPLSISTDSVLLGNSGYSATNSSSTEFRYQFAGLEGHTDIQWKLSNWFHYQGGLSVIRNQQAPDRKNQAYLFENQARIIFSDDFSLLPSFDFFRAESDATIANYNDSGISTNRIGYRAGLGFQIQELFKIAVAGGERTVLVETPSLDRERFVTVTLETLDAEF